MSERRTSFRLIAPLHHNLRHEPTIGNVPVSERYEHTMCRHYIYINEQHPGCFSSRRQHSIALVSNRSTSKVYIPQSAACLTSAMRCIKFKYICHRAFLAGSNFWPKPGLTHTSLTIHLRFTSPPSYPYYGTFIIDQLSHVDHGFF